MLARVLAMALCLSVCLSVCVSLSQVGVLSKRMDESGWFLASELPSIYSTLCCKKIRVYPKRRVLPSGTFVLNSGIRKFHHSVSIV